MNLPERGSLPAATQQLRAAVQALIRARRRQIFAEAICTGLFCGLAAGCVALLSIRLAQLPLSVPWTVAGLLSLALIVALLLAWRRRPDSLQVAIRGDLELKLKQQLSTAWEFAGAATNPDPALGERLAVQAVRARLPQQPWLVFPVRINLWGGLIPVAAALLVLLAVLDLRPNTAPAAVAAGDPEVIEQGVRLREYAERMETRARLQDLPRSTHESQNIRRLGGRMASGTLSRDEALERLRRLSAGLGEQRQAALAAGTHAAAAHGPAGSGPQHTPGGENASAWQTPVDEPGLQGLLEELAAGRLTASEVPLSERQRQALNRAGIPPAELDRALSNLAAGDGQGLQRILQVLNDSAVAARELRELDQARHSIARAREDLGDDALAATPGQDTNAMALSEQGPDEGFVSLQGYEGADLSPPGSSSASGYGTGRGEQQRIRFSPQTDTDTEVGLKPVGRLGAGEVFSSPVRALPRPAQPVLDTVELDPRYSARVEQALSKEDVPLHHKELIRRYFLTLSEGVTSEERP